MDLKAYIFRRLLYTIPILLGVTLLIFLMFNIVGGDPALTLLGKHASPKQLDMLRKELGLNKPFLHQYFDLLKATFTFNFGKSWFTKQEIFTILKDGVLVSFSFTFPAFIVSIFLSIGFALISVFYRGQLIDKMLVVGSTTLMSVSALSYILFFQWFFAYKLDWFEIAGYERGFPHFVPYILLPCIIIIFLSIGSDIRLYRTFILDEINQEYVRTARSKGLSEIKILLKHVLKNAMIPIVTNIVIQLPFLLLGALLIESFFGIPGLGGIVIDAIGHSDFPLIKSITVLSAIFVIFCNLLTDIIYTLLDPRIKL